MNIKLFLKQYVKMFSQSCMLPLYYAKCAKQPVKPGLILFADAHHDARPENMQLLYEALQQKKKEDPKLNLEIRELYLNYQKAAPGTVLKAMFQFMKLYAQAGSVVICDNFLPAASCKKRKETRVIQLWHACGSFKKFGYDTEDDIPKQYHGNVFQNTDLVTVSAPGCVKPFASAMRLKEENVRPIGVSRTDVYYSKHWQEECRREFYARYPEAVNKKIVLWAPTFRGSPGDPQLVRLDLKRLQQSLGDEWLVLSHVHPHMHEQYRDTDCSMASERLFPVTDVLIADYSSLIYEYLLFKGSMVLYVPDLEDYQKKRGFYLDFDEIPGVKAVQEDELAEAVREQYTAGRQDTEQLQAGRRSEKRPQTEQQGERQPQAEQQGERQPQAEHESAVLPGIRRQNAGRSDAGWSDAGRPGSGQTDTAQDINGKRERFLQKYMSGCDGHATERIVHYILSGE